MTRFLTPYAAKAVVQHEFDTDHLNIWVIFRFTMRIANKPADTKWIPEVDGVTKSVASSVWIDEFTLLLTVNSIASHPDRVTLTYDGPDQSLTTTWGKQWEPWEDILSSDSIGLPFGNFFGNEIDFTQVAAQNIWYTISDADITATPLHRMTFLNNQELKIEESGFYLLNYYLDATISIAGKHVLTAPGINSTEQLSGSAHYEFGQANEEITISASAILQLLVDDLITLKISTEDTGNPTITVCHVGLTLTQIGVS